MSQKLVCVYDTYGIIITAALPSVVWCMSNLKLRSCCILSSAVGTAKTGYVTSV